MGLTGNGKVLVITVLFYLLFGGYLIGMDQYHFNDIESALTVFLIYSLLGLFTTLFILGKRYGIIGVMLLETIFLVFQTLFIVVTLSHITDAGLHDPIANWWATVVMYFFALLTLIFSVRVYKET